VSTIIKLAFASLVFGIGVALAVPAEAHLRRDCCPPPPPKTVILEVCHPCTHCTLQIPVCIPACCDGVPKVCFERTLIGHGKTVFEWCCGHRVVIRYHHDGYRVVQHN
jgi:hypothetical protein